jgi:hypothetical protein
MFYVTKCKNEQALGREWLFRRGVEGMAERQPVLPWLDGEGNCLSCLRKQVQFDEVLARSEGGPTFSDIHCL